MSVISAKSDQLKENSALNGVVVGSKWPGHCLQSAPAKGSFSSKPRELYKKAW
jgi:hypothetical protein